MCASTALACPSCCCWLVDRAICSFRAAHTLGGGGFADALGIKEAVCCSSTLVWEDEGGGDPGRVRAAVELGVRFLLEDAGEVDSSPERAVGAAPLAAGGRVLVAKELFEGEAAFRARSA